MRYGSPAESQAGMSRPGRASHAGLPASCIGTIFRILSASKAPSLISVTIMTGAMPLNVIPRLASSTASDLLGA